MKKRLVLMGAATALLLVSACSSSSPDSPTTSSAAHSASQSSASATASQEGTEPPPASPSPTESPSSPDSQEPPASSEAPAAAPSNTAPPASADGCVPAGKGIPTTVEDFDCLNLVAVSGTDANGEIAWIGTHPFTLVTMIRDGNVAFSSKTPCNTIMSSVKVTDTQFTVDPNMAMTMMACQSPQSDYERWVATLFSTPLNYTLNQDSLVLGNEHGTVTFKIPPG